MTSDLGPCPSHGLTIGAPNIVLDCDGYEIIGNDTIYSGVVVDRKNDSVIKNCVVHNFGSGINFGSSDRVLITNNTAYDNLFHGFAFSSGQHNNLTDNTAYGNYWYGFLVQSAHPTFPPASYNRLENNVAYNNNKSGFFLPDAQKHSDYNTYINNTAYYNNESGFEFRISEGHTIEHNYAYGNAKYGFMLHRVSFSTLDHNTAEDNYFYNFRLNGSSYNNLTGNTANLTNSVVGLDGFLLEKSSDYNSLTENTAYDNHAKGFRVYNASHNNFTDNIAYDNRAGFDLTYGYNNTLRGNTANNTGTGFFVYPGSGNVFDSNTASGNSWEGFNFRNASDGVITNNLAYLNRQGFVSRDSDFNSFTGNEAYNSTGGHGFAFYLGSDHNNISGNTAEGNANNGFYIDNADHNTLTFNTATGQSGNKGYLIVGSTNNTLHSNNASQNGYGFYLSNGASDTTLISNIADSNGQGFLFSTNSGNTATNNTAHGNTISGFYISTANITMSGDHLYGNSDDLYVRGANNLQLNNVVIDSAGGSKVNYTELSMTDSSGSLERYTISWAADPGAPDAYHVDIANKFLDIVQVEGTVSIDSLTFHWLDSEAGTYNESRFELWQKEGTIWRQLNATPVPSANTITTANLNQFGTTGLFHSTTVPDSDGDGVPDDEDDCPYTSGNPEFNGCPYANEVEVRLIVHDPHGWGACPGDANLCELNLPGVDVRVYNKTDPAFVALWGAPQKTEYPDIFEDDTGLIGSCTSDENGLCVVGEVAPGDYLVLGKYYDAAVPATVYTGASKAPSDFNETTGLATKDLVLQKMYKKNGDIQYQGGQVIVIEGSFLEIVAPLMTYWEGTEELYPFVFISDSDWTADVCLEMPSGYVIKGTFDENGNLVPGDCQQEFVSGESKAVIFTVEDVGSPPPHAKAKIKARGPKGGVHNVEFEIPGKGIEKAAEKGKGEKKGKPFQQLQDLPLPVLLLLAVIAILVAAALFMRRRKQ